MEGFAALTWHTQMRCGLFLPCGLPYGRQVPQGKGVIPSVSDMGCMHEYRLSFICGSSEYGTWHEKNT